MALVLTGLLAACASRAAGDGRVPVVATFSIAGDWAKRVGGDRVEVTTLVGPDGDAHVYEPTPADAVALAHARVVVENGLGFESWLDDLYAASGSTARRVVMTAGIRPRRADSNEEEAGRDAEGDPSGSGREVDPHVWHSLRRARTMVAAIRDGLIAADPDGADRYRANAAAYLGELARLDREVRKLVAGLPPERRVLVTNHDTFGYFAADLGFRVLGSSLPSVSTAGADPSAADIARLAAQVRRQRVPAIFAENVADDRLVRQLARAAGVELAPPLYTDALGPKGSPGETYLGMMRYNVRTIVAALGGRV
jgi:zinc/manganese transport system substrate-binding protein